MASSSHTIDAPFPTPPPPSEVDRLRSLFASGALMHPYLSAEHFSSAGRRTSESVVRDDDDDDPELRDNFVDLAASLAMCCGVRKREGDHRDDRDGEFLDDDLLALAAPVDGGLLERRVRRRRMRLASEIGGGGGGPYRDGERGDDAPAEAEARYARRHIVLILCDGMGNSVLSRRSNGRDGGGGGGGGGGDDDDDDDDDGAMPSFFASANQPSRLRAVFPSTTPAALTTLATAAWPGRHGEFFGVGPSLSLGTCREEISARAASFRFRIIRERNRTPFPAPLRSLFFSLAAGMPGWNLRDKRGCDLPGRQDDGQAAAPHHVGQPVQLLVLSDRIRDARSGGVASTVGFESWDDVFVEVPWAPDLSSPPPPTIGLRCRRFWTRIPVVGDGGGEAQDGVRERLQRRRLPKLVAGRDE